MHSDAENEDRAPQSVQEILDRIETVGKGEEKVALQSVIQAAGATSFSPLLLLAGLITLAPVIGDIPGVPTTVGLLVVITGGQLLVGRKRFWLPQWLLKRSIDRKKMTKGLRWLRPVARFFDRISKPRLTGLVAGSRAWGVIVISIGIALIMPVMEVVPFSANAAGAALTAFGLALIARDGVIAIIAFVFTGVTAGFIVSSLL